MKLSSNSMGIVCLIAGIFVFSGQDLILKLISGDYPLHEAMVLRSLTAIPFLLMLVARNGGIATLFTPGMRAMIWRGAIMCVAYTCYYIGLPALPMATAVALYFSAPLFITLLSVLMLHEKVGPGRWIAVLVGFAGVLIMVGPSAALFEWAALLPVISGMTYGLSMIFARRLGTTETAAALAFWGNMVFLAFAILLALALGDGRFATGAHPSLQFLLRAWVWPSVYDALRMCGCGVIAAAGLTLLTQAYRVAEANAVAPFEYSAMIWGVLWGWMFFSDLPDARDWLGIAVIVAAGLAVLWQPRAQT